MRVFEINEVYGTGSTGHIVARLKAAVESGGGECMAAYGRGQVSENGTYRIGSDLDLYLHALLTRFTDRTAFFSGEATRVLTAKIREFAPDVIHLHNLHGYYLNIEILFDFFKAYERPVIWTLHDCWSFTGHCPYFTQVKCEKWQSHCSKCPQKSQYPASWWIDHSRQNFVRKQRAFTGVPNLLLVTPSQWLSDLVGRSFLKDYPVKVIPNGIDTALFRPVPSNFRAKYGIGDRFLLLGVANLWSEERKGLADYIRLADRLGEGFQIVLVGTLGKRDRLPEKILHISRTESMQELAEIYSSADLFLNLTYEDNYPTVNLEALACGTPVLTYASGGSPESVKKGYGFVVTPGDLDEVADCIVRYRKNPGECRMGNPDFDRGFLEEKREIAAYLQLMQEAAGGGAKV